MKLNENIKNIRKAKGLRQEQLAEAMGVSTASVSKWETGQTAPELTILVDLADFFEMSIDALLGHQVTGNRMETMLAEMEQMDDEGNYEKAVEIAEKLLQCYPNEEVVVDKVAKLYYRISVSTADKSAMEKSIELTKRMFALVDDSTGAKRFELLSSLGNQYALIEDWEQAKKYYEEGNVGKMNDRALAGLLAKEGKDEEAVAALSDVFVESLFHMITDIFQMTSMWETIGESKKAEDALLWAAQTMETLTGEAVAHLVPVKNTMYFLLAVSAESQNDNEKADEFVRKAIMSTNGTKIVDVQYDFLKYTKAGRLLGNTPTTPEMVIQMLQSTGMTRLVTVAEEFMKRE